MVQMVSPRIGSRSLGWWQEMMSGWPETSKWRCTTIICMRKPTGSMIRRMTLPHSRSLTTYLLCFQYFVFTGVLAMVTCAVFLRLNSVLKLAVLLIMIAIYALLTETIYAGLFLRYDNLNHSGE